MNFYQNKKIIITNLSKRYNDTLILKDINLHINEGEIVSLIGPSGSGKSTLLNIISKLTQKDEGEIIINGKISYMCQKDLLLNYKKVIENVALPLIIAGKNKKEAIERVKPYFKIFKLENYENKYPKELSGGMRQRVNFLRTYLSSSDIMLLDEPFASLDTITKNNIHSWFLSVIEKLNSTIFLITHDIDEAIKLSNRIYLLSSKPATIKKEIDLKNLDKKDMLKISILKNEIIELLDRDRENNKNFERR